MNALLRIYKHFFRPHTLGLLLCTVCCIISAAEGSAMSAIGRYLIDEVLEINLMIRPMLHGQPGTFVAVDPGLPNLPTEQVVSSRQIVDRDLPSEGELPVLSETVNADGSLQDRIEARPGKPTALKLELLLIVSVIMVLTHIFGIGCSTWSGVKMGYIARRVVMGMRQQMHEKLMRLQLSFHSQHQTGRLLARAIDDTQVIEQCFTPILTNLAVVLGLLIVNTSLMFYISPKLTVIALTTMPFYFWAHKSLCDRIRTLHRTQRKKNAALYGLIRDRLANPRIIKGFGQEKREQIHFYARARDLFGRNRRIVILNNLLSQICTVIAVLATAVPLGYGILMVRSGELTVGYLLFFYGVSWGLFWPIAVLSTISAHIQWVRIACERVLEVLDEPIIIADKTGAKDLDKFRREIVVKNLNFRYSETTPWALQQIELSITRGSRVCLMGSSGAGKSTLGIQLLRLYDPTGGEICVDGINLKDIKLSHWRKRISYVPQEPVLFSGTLASNILYGNADATPEQMVAAAKAAEIHDFIETLPEKYHTVIGENGMRLSGGQKQRISLARALVTDPDILVLDDCTSALDAETEAKIQTTFKTALANKTVVMISHRVSAASNADKIVVLDQGKIAEIGTHEELFDRHGAYWSLVKDQLAEHSVVAMPARHTMASSAA